MGKDAITKAEALASTQHGAIARRQAKALHVTDKQIRRLVSTERWIKTENSVYLVAGSAKTFERKVITAVLGESEGAAASHLAAGVLHGLVTVKPARIDVTVPHGDHDGRRPGKLVHRARSMGRSDVTRVRGIRVTCVARTLVDLAGVTNDDELQHALDTALNKGLVTIGILERYISDRNLAHLRGVGRLRRFIQDRKAGAYGSGLERKFRRILKISIPQPDRQGGIEDYYVDFVYTEYRIFIEIDGDYHGTVAQLRKDDRRQNKIVLAGYMPLRFTEDRLDDEPDVVCDEVEAALRARGWRPKT